MGMLEDAIREYATFLDRAADPSAPPADQVLVYVKDGGLYLKDSAGLVTAVGNGGGGNGGAWQQVAVEVTSSYSESEQFTLPTGTRLVRITAHLIRPGSNNGPYPRFRLNGDTGTNYTLDRQGNATGSNANEDHWRPMWTSASDGAGASFTMTIGQANTDDEARIHAHSSEQAGADLAAQIMAASWDNPSNEAMSTVDVFTDPDRGWDTGSVWVVEAVVT